MKKTRSKKSRDTVPLTCNRETMGLEPRVEWQLSQGNAILCNADIQEGEKEGCWNITTGYVFIQESRKSGP